LVCDSGTLGVSVTAGDILLSADCRRGLSNTGILGKFTVIDLTSGKPVASFDGMGTLVWSPDGQRIAGGGGFGTIKVWNTARTGTGDRVLRTTRFGEGNAPVWSADSRKLVEAADLQGAVRVWDFVTGEEHVLRGWPEGMAAAPAERKARALERLGLRGQTPVKALLSPNEKHLAVAQQLRDESGIDEVWEVWDLATRRRAPPISRQTLIGRVAYHEEDMPLAWSPDDRLLAMQGKGGSVQIWDMATGKEGIRLRGLTGDVLALAWSPDGRQLAATGRGDGLIKVWLASSGQEIITLRERDLVHKLAWSPDGRRLACISGGGSRSGIRSQDGSCAAGKARRGRYCGVPMADAWSAGMRSPSYLTRCSSSTRRRPWTARTRCWDIETGTELKRFEGHDHIIWVVALSPDRRWALSGSQDRTVRLWNVESGQEARLLAGHKATVSSVAFSPDGRRAFSANWDRTVRVWDVASGSELKRLDLQAPVLSMALSRDGRRVLLGSNDGVLADGHVQGGRGQGGMAGAAGLQPIQLVRGLVQSALQSRLVARQLGEGVGVRRIPEERHPQRGARGPGREEHEQRRNRATGRQNPVVFSLLRSSPWGRIGHGASTPASSPVDLMIQFRCPVCETLCSHPRPGDRVLCPACGQKLEVPAPPHKTVLGTYEHHTSALQPTHAVHLAGTASPVVHKAAQATAVLCRCCSPSLLALTFLLLPLPFLAVSCESPAGPQTWVTQSGLQILTGGHSVSRNLAALQQQAPGLALQRTPDEIGMAGDFAVVLLLLLASGACGFALPAGELRAWLAGGFLLAALVALYGQMAAGFPVEQKIAEAIAKGWAGHNRLGGALVAATIRVRYTVWFWLWLALLHLAAVALTVETFCARLFLCGRPRASRRALRTASAG
jgi:WD40 repeat protein